MKRIAVAAVPERSAPAVSVRDRTPELREEVRKGWRLIRDRKSAKPHVVRVLADVELKMPEGMVRWDEKMLQHPDRVSASLLEKDVHVVQFSRDGEGSPEQLAKLRELKSLLPRKILIVRAGSRRRFTSLPDWLEWNREIDSELTLQRKLASAAEREPPGAIKFKVQNGEESGERMLVPDPVDDSAVAPVGIDALRGFIRAQKAARGAAGRSHGLAMPKGVLLVGPPGTGKSTAAKLIARELGLKLYRVSMSDFGVGFVSQSETNLRAMLEAANGRRIVLLLDEIEKMFPAPNANRVQASGESAVLSELLRFLDTRKNVYVVMTANDATGMPPELMRRERIDEVFYVGLPEKPARAQILDAYLRQAGWQATADDVAHIAGLTQGYSPPELKQIAQQAIAASFLDGKRSPHLGDLVHATQNVRPLSITNKAQVDEVQHWARRVQARDAAARRGEARLPHAGLVEVMAQRADETLAGFGRFKRWMAARANLHTDSAAAAGLRPPRGVLLVGVPGAGKTLAAELSAQMLGVPLLRLSMERLRGGGRTFGENLLRALREIEDAGRVVVLADELDKMMGVAHDEPAAMAELLRFLNDPRKSFVVATANDLSKLPAEYLRKGRFDEIFFVDLPTTGERREILRARLQRIDRRFIDVPTADLPALAAASERFAGGEIAQTIEDARIAAWSQGQRPVTTADLLRAFAETRPLAVREPQKIAAMRSQAALLGVPASDDPAPSTPGAESP